MVKFIRVLVLSCASLWLFSGCETDDRDYALDLYVTVQDGEVAAQNALVHIYAPVENTTVDYYLYTDEEGKVTLTLKNRAVLEIVATKRPYKSCTFAALDRGVTTVYLDMTISGDPDSGCRDDQ